MKLIKGDAVRNNKSMKESFFRLGHATFGLQYEQWDKYGYWDESYTSYAFEDEGEIVANVSTSEATMVLDRKPYKAVQIGGVMTDPKYRGQGLSRKLMEKVIEDALDADIIYLFANASVLDFYPKFGFEKRTQSTFFIHTEHLKRQALEVHKLNIADEKTRQLVFDTATDRLPTSKKMAMLQNESIVMFHALTQYREDLYYVPQLKTIVIAKEFKDRLQVIDILSKEYIDTLTVLNALPIKAPKVELCFTPDILSIPVEQGVLEDDGAMFVKEQGKVSYPNHIIFPYSGLA